MGEKKLASYEPAVSDWKIPGPFSRDPFYLLKYFSLKIGLLLPINLGLVWTMPSSHFDLHLNWYGLVLAAIAFYVGALGGVFIHNASHKSFRPLWLNRWVGEIMGLMQLYGFPGWQMSHLVHHKYPDQSGLDPHPPREADNFFIYAMTTSYKVWICLFKFYLKLYGKNETSIRTWRRSEIAFYSMVVMTVVFWYLLLGPTYFISLFIPSFLGTMVLFSHLNYYTHVVNSEGKIEIVNLTEGLRFRILNKILFGTYYHKYHHLQASLFNPKKFVDRELRLQQK